MGIYGSQGPDLAALQLCVRHPLRRPQPGAGMSRVAAGHSGAPRLAFFSRGRLPASAGSLDCPSWTGGAIGTSGRGQGCCSSPRDAQDAPARGASAPTGPQCGGGRVLGFAREVLFPRGAQRGCWHAPADSGHGRGEPWAGVVGAPAPGLQSRRLLPCRARSTARRLTAALPSARLLTPSLPSHQLTVTVAASTRN